MPDLNTGKDCCGCTACASVCSHDAIEMKPDGLGFLYPQVDYEKCVECKLCEKVCAFNDDYDIKDNFAVPETRGARLKDIGEVMKSRSGGAFVAFSDWILDNGGVVYGAGYKDHFRVAHKRADSKEARDEFRGSKYVQSDLTGVLRQVRSDLQSGRKVMFSGTPCQTSALRSYIPSKLQENLWLVDIVCHGVPSPYYWRDYIAYLEKKHGKKIVSVDFRNKSKFGWHKHKETFRYQGSAEDVVHPFTFYRYVTQRESCSSCHFCNVHRPSDLTLADFWGWERTGSDINKDDKGLSLVLINTPKGKELFETVADRMNVVEATLEQSMQSHLQSPTPDHPKRVQFEKDYMDKGLEYVMKKYGNVGWRYNIRNYFKTLGALPARAFRTIKRRIK